MAEPFLSEIRLMSFNFAPRGWAMCNGQFLPINQNMALFALIGTYYGGNGQTNFALPDLRGRTPIHVGNGHTLGERAGSEATTVISQQMPQHAHGLVATTAAATRNTASDSVLATASAPAYAGPRDLVTLSPTAVTSVGGSQAHTNMQPYLTLNFCIALQGIFPSQN